MPCLACGAAGCASRGSRSPRRCGPTLVFSSDRRRPIGASTAATSSRSASALLAGAVDHDHEVVRVADEPVGCATTLADALAPVHSVPIASHSCGEVIVEDGQGDVGQQRGEDPTLRGAGDRVRFGPVLGEDPGLQERLHQRQDALVPDSAPHPVHEGRVVDLVEARLDVRLEHPLVAEWVCEVVDLGDRVLRSAPRAEAVGTRLEVRLEDRLEHQLQSRLHDPVPNGRDTQPAQLAAAFGIIRSRTGNGTNSPAFRSSAARRGTPPRRGPPDGAGRHAVDPRGACTPVAPHPVPRHKQERRIIDEVEQIIEPTTQDRRSPIGAAWSGSPVPAASPHRDSGHGASVFTGDLLAFQSCHCELAAPLRHVTGFPDLGLLRRLRPTPTPSADDGPSRRRPGWPVGRGHQDGSHVHHDPFDGVGAQLCPCSHRHEYAADLPRGLPAGEHHPAGRPDAGRHPRQSCAAAQPTSARFELVVLLRGFTTLVSHVHLSVSLAGPGPSGSTDPSRRCQGCSHPPRRLPDQAAPSFNRPAATARR